MARMQSLPNEAQWALIKAAQAGDGDAFTKLLTPYLYIIYAIVREKIPQREVEDVVQQVYLAVWVGLSGYLGTGSFKAWLRAVARRTVASYHRRVDSSAPMVIRASGDDLGAQEALERAEDRAAIDVALVQLPHRHRAVLLLHIRDGLSFAEVGEELGIKEGAARVLCYRAKVALRSVEV